MSKKDKRTLLLVVIYLTVTLVVYQSQKLFPALQDTGASVGKVPPSASNVAMQILHDCNRVRGQQGLPPLVWEDHLAQAAAVHSQDMIDKDYFEHHSPNPTTRTVVERVNQTGISPDAVGECIFEAEGYPPVEVSYACVDSWLHSPAHNKIMLSPRYGKGGVGVSHKGNLYRITMVFSATP